jgi:hypothetical protein
MIGILCILAGLIYLFPAMGKYGVGDLIILSGQTFHGGPFVLTASIIAIANLAIGLGCLYGWRPIWFYLVIVSLINFFFAVVVLFNTDTNQLKSLTIGAFWFVITAYVLIEVQSRTTRTWFRV